MAVSTETVQQDTSCGAEKTHPEGDTCDLSGEEVPDMPKAGGAKGSGQSHVFPELTGGVAGRGGPETETGFLGPTDPSLGGSSLAK